MLKKKLVLGFVIVFIIMVFIIKSEASEQFYSDYNLTIAGATSSDSDIYELNVDDDYLYVGLANGTLFIYNKTSLSLSAQFNFGDSTNTKDIVVDSNYVYFTLNYPTLITYIINKTDWVNQKNLSHNTGNIALGSDNNNLYIANTADDIYIYNKSTWINYKNLTYGDGLSNAYSLDIDNNYLYVGYEDCNITIFNKTDWSEVITFASVDYSGTTLKIVNDDNYLYVGNEYDIVFIYNKTNWQNIKNISYSYNPYGLSVNEFYIIMGGYLGSLKIYNVTDFSYITEFDYLPNFQTETIRSVIIDDYDNNIIWGGSSDLTSEIVYFVKMSFDISIDYPSDNSWLNNNVSISLNFSITNLTTLDTCLYSTNNYVNNVTISGCTNTNFNISDGNYVLKLWVNDSNSFFSETETNFTVDTTYPLISMISPSNNTNTTDNSLDVKYTYTELNVDSCWWNDNDGSNTTLSSCENITTKTWIDGSHDVNIYLNDSAGNINSTSIFFTIDTTAPVISIINPKSQTYSTNESLALDYTVTDANIGVDKCWYKVINSTSSIIIDNTTITDCTNLTFNIIQGTGTYNLTLYSNDTLNNVDSSIIEFAVSLINPSIVLDGPSDNSYSDTGTNTYFNFTATDLDGLSECQLWHDYGNGNWHKNYTWSNPPNATQNFTTLNLTDAAYIWNVWCNDTFGFDSWALNNKTVTIDTINPVVTISNDQNESIASLSITVNYEITDTNINECYFTLRTSGGSLHNYPENTSLICSATSRSFSTLSYGDYKLQIWAEDYAGRLTDANLTFTTRATVTGGGSGSTEVIDASFLQSIVSLAGFCGDNICQADENPTNCWQDCKIDFDSLITCIWDDDIDCNWNQTWFPTALIAILTITTVTSIFMSERKKSSRRK